MKNNKTLILSTFLSLLIVGCSNASSNLPSSSSTTASSSQSSSSSSTTSSSTSSSSSSSTTSSSSSSSSTSSITSSSSSGSTSEPPVTNTKVPFNQIGSLVAQIVDAKALGVANSKDNVRSVNARRNSQADVNTEEQNKMVKVTETYNPITNTVEDNTIEVTFQRTTNTQTTELQTGSETYVASAEAIIIEEISNVPGNIVINNVLDYEFRLVNGGVVIQDWTRTVEETLEFEYDEALTDVIIESRSFNASISFTSFEGFTYEVKAGETIIISGVVDNGEGDTNEKNGVITIDGITQGLPYDVHYSGFVVLETVTQDEVDGQVDKLYVSYGFTFISFVPLTLNNRPKIEELEKKKDVWGKFDYDKIDYFSDSTRQSFVINNNTGLIYKIDGTYVMRIDGELIFLKDNHIPFDFFVQNDQLIFEALYSNSSIITFSGFRDKYGNKFIHNNRLNTYDANTNTHYFVQAWKWESNFLDLSKIELSLLQVENFKGHHAFYPLENYEVLKITYTSKGIDNGISSVKMIGNHGVEESPVNYLNLKINGLNSVAEGQMHANRILNNKILFNDYFTSNEGLASWGTNDGIIPMFLPSTHYPPYYFYIYDIVHNKIFSIYYSPSNSNVSMRFLEEHDILLELSNETLLMTKSFFSDLNVYIDSIVNPNGGAYYNSIHIYSIANVNNINIFNYSVLLNDVSISGSTLSKFGLSGNIFYDLILEKVNDEMTLVPYVAGTYVAPAPTTITFQPINR